MEDTTAQEPSKKKFKPSGTIQTHFSDYSAQYDDHNDRYERVVKISRDITVKSKRLIFLLHRIAYDEKSDIEQQASEPLYEIHSLFEKIIQEIDGYEYWRYQRAFTPGLQEYIEAVSYLVYLTKGELVSKQYIENIIAQHTPDNDYVFNISANDYLLGISDLTGELMRLCVNSVSLGHFELCVNVCVFLENMLSQFNNLSDISREMQRKINVMSTSVKKVENVALTIRLKETEYTKEQMMQFFANNPNP
eukprot:TRINITY_DN829_c0_g1_i2.p1 TRINITY_DN829_c0_g1~~TRINITY_DN829_c0_g1_i2.p1  ORF type:complete len:249 (-),score=54.51 TRINITY_DN829_c0_g1_i2:193-939(-)